MAKFRIQWFLFNYKNGLPDIIAKQFETKAEAEKARENYPAKQRGGIGVGFSRTPVAGPKRKN